MNLSEKQEKLAIEIAYALDDMESIQWHRTTVVTYSEEFLRSKLQRVLSMSPDKIRVSRAALYNSLVQGHAKRFRS